MEVRRMTGGLVQVAKWGWLFKGQGPRAKGMDGMIVPACCVVGIGG
jgi:hypothetical protein